MVSCRASPQAYVPRPSVTLGPPKLMRLSRRPMTRRSSGKNLLLSGVLGAICLGSLLADAQISSFQHIVVIVQENRTPDNLFQGLCAPPYGAPGLCSATPTSSQYDIQTK